MSIAASLPDGTLRRVYPDRTEDIRGRGDDVWFDTEIVSPDTLHLDHGRVSS
jgi:hypothetical protein